MKKIPLHEIAYQKIKEKIMRGDFIEQNYTSQNQLVDELEMSRTPILSALQRLQYEGFVKIISNSGVIIQELSIKEINDFFDMRLAIEPFSLKRVIQVISDDDCKTLQELIAQQKEALASNDYFMWLQLDADFHQYLLEIEGNSAFLQVMSNIRERLFFNSTCYIRKNKNFAEYIDGHERICQALVERNLEMAVQELETHIQSGKIALF